MGSEHVDDDELIAFVLGDLPAQRCVGFEAHVSACSACAERLQREAALELSLVEVAAARRTTAPRRQSERRWRRALVMAAPLAAAALLALVGTWPRHALAPTVVRVAPVVCPDGHDQASCIEDAHRAGLMVRYPFSASAALG